MRHKARSDSASPCENKVQAVQSEAIALCRELRQSKLQK
jgi:hypothetical protein